MLAAYREQKKDQTDTPELEVHLEHCASCRQVLAQHHFIGESIRCLPPLEPSPDAHSKLMQALAANHSHFAQRSSSVTPIPKFLVPYQKEHAHKMPYTDALTAFSTADTGPIPFIRTPMRRHRPFQMNHLAILGLASVFLMILMVGGLTSLLLSANRGLPGPGTSASITQFSQVTEISYTTTTPYTKTASAVATRASTYYTAYSNDMTGWMLQRLDHQTMISTPLLPQASPNPLIVLGSSNEWLVWLQLDIPKIFTSQRGVPHDMDYLAQTWSLHALSLKKTLATASSPEVPETLLTGIFDQSVVPDWVHTPIQGIWFVQNTLLVTMIDEKGASSLVQCQLDATQHTQPNKLATATNGHILTSPTANSDGTSIYWAEEWFTDGNVPHSNIWAQKTTLTTIPSSGQWTPHLTTSQYQLRSDEMSFHPQVVNDTLFLLSTNDTGVTNDVQATPDTTATTMATTTPGNNLSTTPAISRIDPITYLTQPDESIQGTILAFSTDNDTALSLPLDNNGQSSALQGGSSFLLWQNGDRGFEMYDVVAKSFVTVGTDTVPQDTIFLAVNGESAVWTLSTDNTNDRADATSVPNSTVTFHMFSWPRKSLPAE